jgi:hypothetical protein
MANGEWAVSYSLSAIRYLALPPASQMKFCALVKRAFTELPAMFA